MFKVMQMKNIFRLPFLLLFSLCWASLAYGGETQQFMSLRSDETYMRYGPSTDHPIKWVYRQKGWPVQILADFDQWAKIRDMSGEEGWVHQSLLSTRSYALVRSQGEKPYVLLKKSTKKDSRATLRIEEGALVRVHECKNMFCKVSISSYKGYLEKKSLWGIVQTK